LSLLLSVMPKKSKEHKPVTHAALRLREKLAENIYLLMERHFPQSKYKTPSSREKALAKEARCSWSTIQRALAPIKAQQQGLSDEDAPQSASLKTDTLADLAVVFGVKAADLLTPNYALTHLGKNTKKDGDQDELHRKSG
jgi:hypothetical protein